MKSFARPGGNITGLTLASEEFLAKRLETLSEVVPGATRLVGSVESAARRSRS